MTAIQLRRALPESHVYLFDGAKHFGRGAAYAAVNDQYLLNVRSSNMSGFPDDPAHFERWLADHSDPAIGAFAERGSYGSYLRALISQELARPSGRLHLRSAKVLRLGHGDGGWQVKCAGGQRIGADAVVIATGNLASAKPHDGLVFHNPWAPDTLVGLRPDEAVLIVGTGLTMVDLAQGVRAAGFTGPVLAVSRRGLVPHCHGTPAPARPCPADLLEPGLPVSMLLRRVRQMVRQAAAQDADWRTVIDGLRPVTAALWQSWALPERARFLRHLRPYWDIHRHRIAPAVAGRIAAMLEDGQLQLRRGRVAAIAQRSGPRGPCAQVSIQQRGTTSRYVVEAQRVIFATGAGSGMADDPLVADLVGSGTARIDGNQLGLEVTDALKVVGRDGEAASGLWALGPIVRGSFWECTAVPDIRVQAKTIATNVAHYLQRTHCSAQRRQTRPAPLLPRQ